MSECCCCVERDSGTSAGMKHSQLTSDYWLHQAYFTSLDQAINDTRTARGCTRLRNSRSVNNSSLLLEIGQRPLPDLNFELKTRVDYFLLIYHRHQHRDNLSWFHKRFSIFILRSRNLLNLLRSWLPMLQSWQQGLNFHWNSLKIFKLRQNIYPNFRTGSTFLNLA